jgi:hypothetical protein
VPPAGRFLKKAPQKLLLMKQTNFNLNGFRLYLCIFIALLLIGVILFQVYNVIDERDTTVIVKSEEYRREIETPAKKWLNGYLGAFFRFKYLGNLNWLALPLLFWFLFSKGSPPRPRWQKALAFAWLLSLIFIGVKGFYNPRYQLTLFPLTLAAALVLTWELLKAQKTYVKVLCFAALTLVSGYNAYRYLDQYKLFWNLKVSRTSQHFPTKIVDYLNSHPEIGYKKSKVFVYNQPMYYYHTAKPGIDYMNPFHHDIYLHLFQVKGKRRKMHTYIRKRRRVKYILIGWAAESELKDRMMTEFFNCECRLLFNDHGYRLYEIRDTRLNLELKKPSYQRIKPVRLFNIKKQGIRGAFDIDHNKEKHILTITNLEASKDGQRLLQFGFTSGKKSKIQIPPGKYIHFIVEAKISKLLLNRENYIFIQDYKDNWDRDRLYFSAPYWRTYLISRKIREGSTKFSMGLRFVPNSTKGKLLIKNLRAYVSDTPL